MNRWKETLEILLKALLRQAEAMLFKKYRFVPSKALPGSKECLRNDHDKNREKKKVWNQGGGLGSPRSRFGRVGSMELSDNIRGVT